jgi:hypothetical protein
MDSIISAKKKRKTRCDRNHIVYMLSSPSGQSYVGITYVRGRALQGSLNQRWLAHNRNAFDYNKDTLLAKCLREEGAAKFTKTVVEVVRGKANAHSRERELIGQLKPTLNMECMGRKVRRSKAI